MGPVRVERFGLLFLYFHSQVVVSIGRSLTAHRSAGDYLLLILFVRGRLFLETTFDQRGDRVNRVGGVRSGRL